MTIKEKFELSDGATILVCSGSGTKFNLMGRLVRLVSDDEVRQTLTIVGERTMLSQKASLGQIAFETKDAFDLSPEEARSGDWMLVGE